MNAGGFQIWGFSEKFSYYFKTNEDLFFLLSIRFNPIIRNSFFFILGNFEDIAPGEVQKVIVYKCKYLTI